MERITAGFRRHISLAIRSVGTASLFGACWIGTAGAETVDCTPITSLPATITVQGIYCLTGNLNTNVTAGNAITINTNNVTIDLNGWKLGGLAAGLATEAKGIYAQARNNITIRNGTVRGFKTGIHLDCCAQGGLVEDIRAEQNRYIGIYTEGSGDIVRRNQVVDTGGTTTSNGFASAIVVSGAGSRVLDNDVAGVASRAGSTGIAVGIDSSGGAAAVIEGNRVSDVAGDLGSGKGIFCTASCDNTVIEANRVIGVTSNAADSAKGIQIFTSDFVLVSENRINGAEDRGISYESSTGEYRNNIVSGAATPYTGGTDRGGND